MQLQEGLIFWVTINPSAPAYAMIYQGKHPSQDLHLFTQYPWNPMESGSIGYTPQELAYAVLEGLIRPYDGPLL